MVQKIIRFGTIQLFHVVSFDVFILKLFKMAESKQNAARFMWQKDDDEVPTRSNDDKDEEVVQER